MVYRLGELAGRFELELRGDPQRTIAGVCTLARGAADRLAYLSDAKHAPALAQTRAGAVIVTPEFVQACSTAALVADDAKLAYARVASLFLPPPPAAGIHPSAVVAENAQLDPSASIGPNVVVAAGAVIGAQTVLDPGCVIGAGAVVGAQSHIGANACIGAGVRLGARVLVGPAAVLGARGFGLAQDGDVWRAIPQLGAVTIGDDVEVGAGSTIDRGAIEHTLIEDGVKIDDQVHIAHNCRIGAHTVIAGCTGIAGSCNIGRHCVIGGGVGIGDHVNIVDNVMITGATQVPKSITEPGVYSSTLRAMPARQWRKCLALLRRLDRLDEGLRQVQRRTKE